MQRSAWPEYLDALETYLGRAAIAVANGTAAKVPPALASRPVGPVPSEHEARAHALATTSASLADLTRQRLDEVRTAVAFNRRRTTPRRGPQRVSRAL